MVTKQEYNQNEVNLCLSVLVELITILGEYRDNITLIGGWIPYFLIPESQEEHTGSLDIDIALDFQKISEDTYQTILKTLKSRGYEQAGKNQPAVFYRKIVNDNGIDTDIEIDICASEYGGTTEGHRHQRINDVLARKTRGCDLVFNDYKSIKVSAKMPDGADNEVTMKIANVIPFLVMKGMAIWDRKKEKDAYDIYYTVSNYPGGIEKLIDEFEPLCKNKLAIEGLSKIKAKFNDFGSIGPVWLIKFLEIDDDDERERVQRDAYEKVNAFLDGLSIKPFKEELR